VNNSQNSVVVKSGNIGYLFPRNMTLRWFFSAKVRQLSDLRGRVRRLRDAQRDVLAPPALQAIDAALQSTAAALKAGAPAEALVQCADDLEKTANKWLRPYPHAEWREKHRSFPRRHRCGDGHPHFFSPAVQNPDQFHAADLVWRDH
jgi:hypothetical protein